ncbi:MAG TPA: DNA repair protein RadA [Fimbriimonadales bacterium]|jgi:DNA repair protein RadA/Sms|nr:DNA repair protein RadA [Fimbriimonadales bacterium]
MAKARTVYACQSCGGQSPKWLGRCPDCGAWGTLVEETLSGSSSSPAPNAARTASSILEIQSLDRDRLLTGIEAFDRVLGGGLVPGSIALIGGDPGIGKSTLLTEVSGSIATRGGVALYISGEESPGQIRLRAERLGTLHDSFLLAATNDLAEALAFIQGSGAPVIVVDSIQTLSSSDLDSPQGSVSQVRHCAAMLQAAAKSGDAALVLVGHITKDGSIAGPKVLEHLVDTVLYFEGEGHGRLRALRSTKNRFGATNEIALFEMTDKGLASVEDLSGALLAERQADAPGTAVFAAIEGSRAMLVEMQALVTPNYANNPRRIVTGADFNRVMLVLSVIEKRCGVRLGGADVFVNVVGGVQVREPAADLAIFLAVLSSAKDTPLPADLVAFGEIGLTGEIRSVGGAEMRLAEAKKMGFARAAVSQNLKKSQAVGGIKLGAFRSVKDALSLLS